MQMKTKEELMAMSHEELVDMIMSMMEEGKGECKGECKGMADGGSCKS